ncbi:MAG: GspH/FimT family pseudopilin [Steroidobacteraceae bacterium]
MDNLALTSMPLTPVRRVAVGLRGFTMIELLMAIAVASIMLVIAVPSYRYVTNSNRIASEINGLLGDLQFARAEAIKEGVPVTVCISTDSATCANSTVQWNSGWIVIQTAGTPPLRVQAPFSSTDNFFGPAGFFQVQFNREGYAVGMPNGITLITLHDATDTTAWTRCLAINFSGQMSSELVNTTNINGPTCS